MIEHFWKMEWKMVAALLAGYGFLKEVRPSEPFITPFLTGPDKNFTSEQVNQEIYPVSTYSMLALLVVIFLVTDWLRYKPIIVLQSLSAVAVYSILSWGQGVPLMQCVEALYGLMWAADVAYFTYMYARVERAHYSTVSATARMGFLLGRFGSGVLSQVAVSVGFLSLLGLQYFTLASSLAATLFAVALPRVSTSFYFHKAVQEVDSGAGSTPDSEPHSVGIAVPSPGIEPRPSRATVARRLWTDFKHAYGQLYVVKWSCWWALATGGQMMILSYVQILWQETVRENRSDETLWNGGVEATYTLLGAGVVWLTTRKTDYSAWGDGLVGTWSLAAGAIVLVAAESRSMVAQYIIYVAFGTSYHAAITIASSEVARRVREDAHALVFGVNTLGALLLQTSLTLAVAGEGGWALDIRTQFLVYGTYFVLVGVAFLALATLTLCRRCFGTTTINVSAD